MWHTVTCEKCGSVVKYEDKSTFEGQRDHEEILCPVCKNVLGSVFTDLIPSVYLIEKGKKE